MVQSHLENLGYSVAITDSNSVTSSDANGKNVVVISSTASPISVGSQFKNAGVPVVTWSSGLFPLLGMAGVTPETDFGIEAEQSDMLMSNASHPLAAGLSDLVSVTDAPGNFSWANPSATAVKIATLPNDSNKVVLFGYETGALMTDLSAPARRVGFFMIDDTPDNLNGNGWALFDAAVSWASGGLNTPPMVNITVPADNAIFGANSTVSINADAADPDGIVTKLEFYADGILIGNTTDTPYTFTWNNLQPGNYVLTTVAIDDSGARTTSNQVHITVSTSTATIAGKVTRLNGTTPIIGATVDVKIGNTLITTTTTNSVGSYSFSGVAAGNYDVQASAEGYFTQTQSGVAVSTGTTTAVDFSLSYAVPTNVALNGTASQSSISWGGAAERAVDGNTSGNWNDNSVTCTAVEDRPWWQVDIGSLQPIQELKLWNRTDCCGDVLYDFYVFVSDQPFTSGDIEATQAQPGVTTYHMGGTAGTSTIISVQRMGRYIRVQLGRNERLSLAELQVWAGTLTSPSNPSNLALNKLTTQSGTIWSAYSSRAVDGNTSGNWGGNSVTCSAVQNNSWWQVDLGTVKSLQTVKLWNRTDCCEEALSNFYVFVSDEPFASTDLSATQNQTGVWSSYHSGTAAASTTITVNRTGRYVRVQLAGNDRLSLAEVQVWGGQ